MKRLLCVIVFIVVCVCANAQVKPVITGTRVSLMSEWLFNETYNTEYHYLPDTIYISAQHRITYLKILGQRYGDT